MNKFYTVFVLVTVLCLASPAKLFSQCCNYTDSGQDLGTSPTFGVALGDFDGDGDNDAFTIDAYEDIEIYFNSFGTFTLNQTIVPASGEQDNFGVHVTDIDNDGDIDAVVVPFYSSSSLKIYKNNGTGTFTLFQAVPSNLGAHFAAVVDLDGDGDKDVFLPSWMSATSSVFKNTGTGSFNLFSSITLTNFGQSNDEAFGDFDGDGDIDIVLVSPNAAGRLLLNDGVGNFTDSGQTLGNATEDYTTAEAGDLDKDGDVDLAFGTMYSVLTILKNDGQGGFTIFATYPSGNYDKDMKIVDMDYDNDLDIFVSNYGSHGLEVWSNDGEGNFSLCYQNSNPMPETYSHGFDVGLINADNNIDAFMGEFGGDGDKVFFGDPGFSVQIQLATICEGETYTFPDGSIGDTAEIHYSNFTSSMGCDSSIITTLSVIYVNELVVVNQQTLTAAASNADYQWLDCNNNFAVIPNQTAQSFSPTQSGSYAVEVTQNTCVDTSICYTVIVTGIKENTTGNIQFYPNPAGDELNVMIENCACKIQIFNIQGQIILSKGTSGIGLQKFSLLGLNDGIYFLKIINTNGNTINNRFIINK